MTGAVANCWPFEDTVSGKMEGDIGGVTHTMVVALIQVTPRAGVLPNMQVRELDWMRLVPWTITAVPPDSVPHEGDTAKMVLVS